MCLVKSTVQIIYLFKLKIQLQSELKGKEFIVAMILLGCLSYLVQYVGMKCNM